MDQTCFDELLEMVKPQSQKQDTNMRKSIPAGEKLALTLRYLATGEFICSALFTSIFVMAKRASLGDRILPKTSCCSQYNELFHILAAYDKYYTSLICLKRTNYRRLHIRFQKQAASQYCHKQTVRTAEETASNGTVYIVAHG